MRRPSTADVRRVSRVALPTTVVLCLAAFNLGFRLNAEVVREWDESLYAITAWEVHTSGHWIATTFRGALDYYNTKPPLNVWLIALSFKVFGVGLVALRLPSVLAAWGTIALLVWWVRRRFDEGTAVCSGLVLATMFAFFYDHSGRTANTDAVNTFLVVLAVVVLSGARDRPWRLAWLGPVLAAVFLLRGTAVVLPLAIVVVDELYTFGFRRRGRWAPTAVAVALFLLPVGTWVVARWRVDQWEFLSRLFWYDFVARSVRTIEGHPGSVFYYLTVLQRRHFDWLIALVMTWVLYPVPLARLRSLVQRDSARTPGASLLVVWAAMALLMPTVIRTKLPWYLNSFYPAFAVVVGGVIAQACRRAAVAKPAWRSPRALLLGAVLVLVVGVAEARLIWYSYHYRDLARSSQGVLLAERDRLKGHTVFRRRLDRGEIFVIHALVGATYGLAPDTESFLRDSRPGDFLLTRRARTGAGLALVRTQGQYLLYRREE
jgi:4-amino-4-deoxy-L-arabinose transferase-like glycosyltransferase